MYGKSHGKSACFTDWLRNGLEQQQSVKLYTDQFRTPLLVNDGVRSILKLLEQPITSETFSYCWTRTSKSLRNLAKICQSFWV
jgi:dTDP-4-dehydrorhamnose reductase